MSNLKTYQTNPALLDLLDDNVLSVICQQALETRDFETLAHLMKTSKRFSTVCKNMAVEAIKNDLASQFSDPAVSNRSLYPYHVLYRIMDLEERYIQNIIGSMTTDFYQPPDGEDEADDEAAMAEAIATSRAFTTEMFNSLIDDLRRSKHTQFYPHCGIHPATKSAVIKRLRLLKDEIPNI